MLRPGNNHQAQLAAKSNFGSVVAVQRDPFEDLEEIAPQLCVAFRNGVSVTRWSAPRHGYNFIHRPHQRKLLRSGSIHEIFSKKLVALLVHAGEPVEKMVAVLIRSPFGENHVDE